MADISPPPKSAQAAKPAKPAKPARVPRDHPGKWVTIANGVTVGRILVTPIVLWALARRDFDLPTFLLWFFACASDGIDGMLARRMGTTSAGAFLDPLADKVLVISALYVLAWKDAWGWFWPLVVVMTVRELWISIYRSKLSARGISLPARQLAKWKTFIQQLAVAFACSPWFGDKWPIFGQLTLLAAAVLTVWSGALYYFDAKAGLSGKPASAA
jgi:CDP-diacylglycerol---glycerol-3-phosphate 3-phosphatidyltransferase